MNIPSASDKFRKIVQILRELDVYPLLRPLLFKMDPEKAHGVAIAALKRGLVLRDKSRPDPILHIKVCGLDFQNPIGLAAGFDKQCEVISEALSLGFGFMEAGGVVPQPQPGNPKPRMFRIPEVHGVINRFDFNSDGMQVCARRIAAWRDENVGNPHGILGVNIAKNKTTIEAVDDYIAGLKTFAPHVDYVAINVSCPNTADLRQLEGREQLAGLLKTIMDAHAALPRKPLIFVKIAPDQTEQQQTDIAAVALSSGVDGMIISNTSVVRPEGIPPDLAKEKGGFSGPSTFEPSTKLLGNMYKLTEGKTPLIGVGGIFNGEDAYVKIRAGASLVQLYTGLVYEGPMLIPRIKQELAALLRRDGFANISEAVGVDHR